VADQFEQSSFVIPNRAESPVRNLLFAGKQQIPRAIRLHFGMATLECSFKLTHYGFFVPSCSLLHLPRIMQRSPFTQ